MWASKEWPKVVKVAPDRYDREQIDAILKAALPEEKIRLLFFFYSGCRDMEVATAEYGDVDAKTNVFTIRAKPHLKWKPKTGEERSQVLPKAFVKELLARKAVCKNGNNLIFPNSVGNVDHNLIEFLQKAAKRAGITERVTQHKIRRTAISHAIDKFGVRKAMAFAGHSNIATTNKYAAPDDMTSPGVRKQVEESFEELVGSAK
jgi:integrase